MNLIRASTFLNNGNFGKLYLKKVHLHGGDSSNHPYMSGIVSRHDKNWIVVSTKSKHMLLIEEVLDKKGNLLTQIKVSEVEKLIRNGTISGGMIPKVETCVEAVKNGVKAAVILVGRLEHSILLEIFTEHGVGTLITN